MHFFGSIQPTVCTQSGRHDADSGTLRKRKSRFFERLFLIFINPSSVHFFPTLLPLGSANIRVRYVPLAKVSLHGAFYVYPLFSGPVDNAREQLPLKKR